MNYEIDDDYEQTIVVEPLYELEIMPIHVYSKYIILELSRTFNVY